MRITSLTALLLTAIALAAGCGRPGEESFTMGGPEGPPKPPRALEDRDPRDLEAPPVDVNARAALPPRAQEALARASLPVLAPPHKELLASSSLVAKNHWFALSAHGDGFSIALHGSKAAKVIPHIPPAEGDTEVRPGAKGFVTQNEGVWTARWIEGGVAYSLDLECQSPAHARCADEREVLALARALVHVGGGAQ